MPISESYKKKQLPRIMKSRVVIIECEVADYIFWQLFLCGDYVSFKEYL